MEPPVTKPKVLVVDDEPSIVDAVATSLRYEGFDVEVAATGRAAFLAAHQKEPDLIILDLRRVMQGIQRESGRMGHLVEDLLLLARLDEGRPLHLEPVDLVALSAEAVTTAAALGPQWPARLDALEPVEVHADALRLRQVIDNLLGNVRVHCPPGTHATVVVRDEGSSATICVPDDGPGLSEEEARRIFERFFRADPSRSRHHGGAGLGLAIVDAIVGAHGGDVSVSEAPEGGARFTVRLPKQPTGHATEAVGDRADDAVAKGERTAI